MQKYWGSASTPSLHADGKWWIGEITDATAPRQPVMEPDIDTTSTGSSLWLDCACYRPRVSHRPTPLWLSVAANPKTLVQVRELQRKNGTSAEVVCCPLLCRSCLPVRRSCWHPANGNSSPAEAGPASSRGRLPKDWRWSSCKLALVVPAFVFLCVCTMQCQRLKRLSRGGILIKEKAGNMNPQGNPWPARVPDRGDVPIAEVILYCTNVYACMCVCLEGCAMLC